MSTSTKRRFRTRDVCSISFLTCSRDGLPRKSLLVAANRIDGEPGASYLYWKTQAPCSPGQPGRSAAGRCMDEYRTVSRFWPVMATAIASLLLSAHPHRAANARVKAPPCAQGLESCPSQGCAQPRTPEALLNEQKRAWPSSGNPVLLTLNDFEAPQGQADALVGQGVPLDQGGRRKLRGLRHSHRQISEGDLVQITGYIVGRPFSVSATESANCRLRGPVNSDFQITIARDPDDSEFDGIAVKMIPQTRPRGWTLEKLQQIGGKRWQVLVRGQLFYDNEHRVNDDPGDEVPGQARRFSLWEVHPVTDFYVCVDKECRPGELGDWKRLEFALSEVEPVESLKPEEVQEEPVK